MTEPTPKPRRTVLAFAPLIAFAALAVTAGAVLMEGGVRRDEIESRMVGKPVPAFTLAALDGQGEVSPAAFAGQPYVINLFASDCGPCKLEHEHLMQLEANGVPILGVAYKDEPDAAARYLARDGDPYARVGLDPDGKAALALGAAGTPETIVVGPDGVIRAFHRGMLTPEIVAERIVPALQP